MHDPLSRSRQAIRRGRPRELAAELDRLLHTLEQAETDLARSGAQPSLFEVAAALLGSPEGLEALYDRAHRFDAAGVFVGGPWVDPSKLQVPLVGGTLRAPGITPVLESLSELRLLAIAAGRAESPRMSRADAVQFLEEVLARNLRYLLKGAGSTEAEREGEGRFRDSHERLFALIAQEIGLAGILDEVLVELRLNLAQRPISAAAIRRMVDRACRLAAGVDPEGPAGEAIAGLQRYDDAAKGPSPLSREHRSLRAYLAALTEADRAALEVEAQTLGESMHTTGLVAPQHASLVRRLVRQHDDLLPLALGLSEAGEIHLEEHLDLARELIEGAVFPATADCLSGLSAALDRTLLSRQEVVGGLERLMTLELREDVAGQLLSNRGDDDDVTANAVLLAGVIAVLGQPLGIGQGNNPTCQSARAISLWAQHDPAHLLELIVAGARDGGLQLMFSGELIESAKLPHGVAAEVDLDLDPVSIVLVPHLDRFYSEFMRRSVLRMQDAHKWVNPALYGRWVANELASAFADVAQTTVADFDRFVRCFYATHHPAYNGGHRLMYPNPVGLVITNHHGKYLGPHAVSIQRVDEDAGEMRVYFFNPNNEGRQDWGRGVEPTVWGQGEVPGESSLPFAHFASRLYAFHYNPHEEGDHAAVPADLVAEVSEAARTTWGEHFQWIDGTVPVSPLGIPLLPPPRF